MDDAHTFELPFTSDPQIDLEASCYPLEIETAREGERPTLVIPGRHLAPRVEVQRDGEVVRVTLDWDEGDTLLGWLKWGRPTRVTVRVPPRVRGRMHTGAGSVRVRDLDACDLALETGAGSIHAGPVTGRVALMTTAGSIHADDLEGHVSLHTSAGSIRARVRDLAPGVHEIRSDAGSVKVELGAGTRVNVVPSVAFGHAKIDVSSHADAAAMLRVGSAAGSVTVRPWHIAERRREDGERIDQGPYRARAPRGGDLEHVLQLVADHKLTPDEASELIRALDEVG